jgi:hypothetical protein
MHNKLNYFWLVLVALILVVSLVPALSAPVTVGADPPTGTPTPTPVTPTPTPVTPTPTPVTPTPTPVTPTPTPCVGTPNPTYPEDGATGVDLDDCLYWDAALNANDYNVYSEAWDDEPELYGSTGGTSYCTNLDCNTTYYWQIEARDLGPTCTASGPVWSFTTQRWPDIEDAVTGWEWIYPYATIGGDYLDEPQPYNTNDRTSIMVVFEDDEYFSPADINASNFRVTYQYSSNGRITNAINETPTAAVVHYWNDDCDFACSGWDGMLVFLTVSKPMVTDCEPTVYLLDGRTVVDTAYGDDGIAPIITLSYTGDPYQGGLITVTATATEDLLDAELVAQWNGYSVDGPPFGLPTTNFFPPEVEEPDMYGGYCESFDSFGYTDDETVTWSTDPEDNIATWTVYMEAQDPQETFFIEVYAHDYTWCDYGDGEWWEHEKWSSASQTIQSKDTIVLHLVEGWNLISFPRTPATPTLRGTFGDNVVSKVYTYSSGRWSGAIYDPASGNWVTPAGFGALTSLQAGVGYWVYCSNAGVDQSSFSAYLEDIASYYSTCNELDAEVAWTDLRVEVQPAAVGPVTPPSYALSAGWNLVGVPVQGSLDAYQLRWDEGYSEIHHAPVTMVSDFMASVGDKWKALYWYLPTYTLWCDNYDESYTFPSGYQIATPGTPQSAAWKMAYWMSAFGSLGISDFPQDVPDWIVPEGMPTETFGTYIEDYDGDYTEYYNASCSNNDYFYFDFDGDTDTGDYIYLDFYGYVDDGNPDYASGWDDDDSYVWNSETGQYEDIDFSFSGDVYEPEGNFYINGSFIGTTDTGRILTGTFNTEWVSNGGDSGGECSDQYYYYMDDIEIDGAIAANPDFIGNFDIDAAKIATPVVMPGYGYWIWMDSAGTLIPSLATTTGSGLDTGGPK